MYIVSASDQKKRLNSEILLLETEMVRYTACSLAQKATFVWWGTDMYSQELQLDDKTRHQTSWSFTSC